MIDAGIHDGDKIVVRKQNTADNGDIVVALIDDSATVKRFSKKKGITFSIPKTKRWQISWSMRSPYSAK